MSMTFRSEHDVVRMEGDLRRALDKPVAQRSWVMAIDVDKCIGCSACRVSCVAENVTPPGVTYRRVPETEVGEYPQVRRVFMPTNCQQCDNPPCVEGLPPGSWTKRPDGIVEFDYDKLKGEATYEQISARCPYAAVYHDGGDFFTDGTPHLAPYETRVSFEYGKRWSRRSSAERSPVDATRKCHFCVHRVEAGMLPACVTTCLGRAMYFGDKNDPQSLVNELFAGRQVLRMHEDQGTEPRVYYLTGQVFDRETCQMCHG